MVKQFNTWAPKKHYNKNPYIVHNKFQSRQQFHRNKYQPFVPHNRYNRGQRKKWINYPPHKRNSVFGYDIVVHHNFLKQNKKRKIVSYSPFFINHFNKKKNPIWQSENHLRHLKGKTKRLRPRLRRVLLKYWSFDFNDPKVLKEKRRWNADAWKAFAEKIVAFSDLVRSKYDALGRGFLHQNLMFRQWLRLKAAKTLAKRHRRKGVLRKFLLSSRRLGRFAFPFATQNLFRSNYFIGLLRSAQAISSAKKLRRIAKIVRKNASGYGKLFYATEHQRAQKFWLLPKKSPKKLHGRLKPTESVLQVVNNKVHSSSSVVFEEMLRSISFFRKHLEFILVERDRSTVARSVFKGISVKGWFGRQSSFVKNWLLFDRSPKLERTGRRNWRLLHHTRLGWVEKYIYLRARYNKEIKRWQTSRTTNQLVLSTLLRPLHQTADLGPMTLDDNQFSSSVFAVVPTKILFGSSRELIKQNLARRYIFNKSFRASLSRIVLSLTAPKKGEVSAPLTKTEEVEQAWAELLRKRHFSAEQPIFSLGLKVDAPSIAPFYDAMRATHVTPMLLGPKGRLPKFLAKGLKASGYKVLDLFYNKTFKDGLKVLVSAIKTGGSVREARAKSVQKLLRHIFIAEKDDTKDLFTSGYYRKFAINKNMQQQRGSMKKISKSQLFAKAFRQKQKELSVPKVLAKVFDRSTASVLAPSFLQRFKKFWFNAQKARLFRSSLIGRFSTALTFSRNARARIPRHIFRRLSQKERWKELKRARGWRLPIVMEKRLIRFWPSFRYYFGSVRQFTRKASWTNLSSGHARALFFGRVRQRVTGLKYTYITSNGWKISKRAKKYNKVLVIRTRSKIMKGRSEDIVRRWVSALPTPFNSLSGLVYKEYLLRTIERISKQNTAEVADYTVIVLDSINKAIKQQHMCFMEAPLRSYVSKLLNTSLDTPLRVYLLRNRALQMKDFVGFHTTSSLFRGIKSLLSPHKSFIALQQKLISASSTKARPKKTTPATLNIKAMLNLAPTIKGFLVPKLEDNIEDTVNFRLKSDKKLMRRIKSYTDQGTSGGLLIGLDDYETTKRRRGSKRRKLTELQYCNRVVLNDTFSGYGNYSRVHGLRNLHYEGPDSIWGRELRRGDAHRRKATEQTRAFKRFIRQHHKQLSRFPRRFNKLALKIHRNVFRAFFRRFLGFNESMLLSLWVRFRRGANRYWTGTGITNLARKFTQSLLLSPQNFLQLLRIAETPSTALALVRFGGVVVNGQTRTELGYFIKPGDTLQVLPAIFKDVAKTSFWKHNFAGVRTKMNNIKFFQIDWSMLLFTMVYWPKDHELVAPSFLSERWIRFYIHFFPGKIRKRHKNKVKMVWKQHRPLLYPSIKKPRKRMKPRPPRQGRVQTKYLYV